MEIFRKYWWILLSSVLLKLIISASTFHPDIRHFDLAGQIISKGNTINLYDYFKEPSDLALINRSNPLNYPPAVYYVSGFFSMIFTPFVGEEFVYNFLAKTESVLGDFRTNLHLLLLKIPYLFFDMLIAVVLMTFFKTQREKFLVFILWVFNPVNIYSTYMLGQFDIIPTLFVVASLQLVRLNKISWAALILGIGAAFKIFPLFLLVPLVLTAPGFIKRIYTTSLGISPYLLSILPFLSSSGFRETALVANQSFKSFYGQINISGGESLLLFPLFLIFSYLIFYFKNSPPQTLWRRYFIVLLLFFIFTHFHPQWFLWMTPFLIIDLVQSRFKHLILVVTILLSFVGMLFFFDPSLTIGLFSPTWSYLYSGLSLWQYLGVVVDYNFSRSVLQTIFPAVALSYIYFSYTHEGNYRNS